MKLTLIKKNSLDHTPQLLVDYNYCRHSLNDVFSSFFSSHTPNTDESAFHSSRFTLSPSPLKGNSPCLRPLRSKNATSPEPAGGGLETCEAMRCPRGAQSNEEPKPATGSEVEYNEPSLDQTRKHLTPKNNRKYYTFTCICIKKI